MSSQPLADGVETGGCHAGDILRCVGGVNEGKGNGKADKVDVRNIDEELGGIEGEFAKVPGQVYIRVCRIGNRRLNECRAGVEEEGQSSVDREPDAASSKVGNSNGRRITRSTERDGAILTKGRAGRRRRCWVVVSLAIGLEQEKSIVVVERLAGDVSVNGAGSRLVLKSDIDGSHCAGSENVVS